MNLRSILGILGGTILLFSPVFLVCLGVALIYTEPTVMQFTLCLVLTVVLGSLLFRFRTDQHTFRPRDSFLVVTLVYVTIALLTTMPFLMIPGVVHSFEDALFEATSMISTTGATVLTGLDELPKSLLFFRQLVCWFGGMGIIVLTVAILPLLGVGGMQLVQAELSGDDKSLNLSLRIQDTARALWWIYGGLTFLCGLVLWWAGMTPFDAISHALSTISIGGFSTHDANIGYFDSVAIEAVIAGFTVIAGLNFMLHFAAVQRPMHDRNRVLHFIGTYAQDAQVRFYLCALFVIAAIICARLLLDPNFAGNAVRDGIFHTISFLSTAGFTTNSPSEWTNMAPPLLIIASFVGACAGSTGGGFKVLRIVILFKQGIREIQQLLQPGALFESRLNHHRISDRMLESTFGFIAMYALTFTVIFAILLLVTSLDLTTAFSAVAACLNNLGPGLGEVAANYQGLQSTEKYFLVLAMILGRLEIFAVLVLFSPRFWRR